MKDCPNVKKKNEITIFKSNKIGKRATVLPMVATWSKSHRCESESEDEEMANLCLMPRDYNGESDEYKEVILEYLLTFTNKYLA